MNVITVVIPPSYKFIPQGERVFVLEKMIVPLNDFSDFVSYSKELLCQTYTNITMDIKVNNIEDNIENGYKQELSIPRSENEQVILRNMYRQIQRLHYCIMGIEHKLVLIQSNYICIVNHSNKIRQYKIIQHIASNSPLLSIVVHIDYLFKNIPTLEPEIDRVYKGIYKILNTNQVKHVQNIKTLMERKDTFVNQSEQLLQQKEIYIELVTKYTELLHTIHERLQVLQQELETHIMSHSDTITSDIKRLHQKQSIEKKIKTLTKTQREIEHILLELQTNSQKLYLEIDTLLFNNVIMTDHIFKNIEHFNKLCTQL